MDGEIGELLDELVSLVGVEKHRERVLAVSRRYLDATWQQHGVGLFNILKEDKSEYKVQIPR